ncbi:hypothetical protein D3C71_1948000 [compost metagenome]
MGDGCQRHFLVQEVRRGDVDDVDVRVGQQFAPVGRRLAKAEALPGVFGALGGHIGDRHQIELERQVEHPRGDGEAERMRLAHEAGANQADAQFLLAAHAIPPGSATCVAA